MSSRLFNRKTQLLIGKIGGEAKEINGLRFSFEISMSDKKETNKGEIKIYGLSDDSVGLIKKKIHLFL
jgi:hypothetical protein